MIKLVLRRGCRLRKTNMWNRSELGNARVVTFMQITEKVLFVNTGEAELLPQVLGISE